MSILSSIFLGLVQGVAEFLPISSSGHLSLFQHFFGMASADGNLFFDVLLHLGTLIAIFVYYRKDILGLMRIPGLWRRVPGLFAKGTRKFFGSAAGFAARELEVTGSVWRIDMTKCPYHDACVRYGCPELCPCFCDSDDITYGDLHPRLLWRRTETLGRGGGRCDFCLKIKEDGR